MFVSPQSPDSFQPTNLDSTNSDSAMGIRPVLPTAPLPQQPPPEWPVPSPPPWPVPSPPGSPAVSENSRVAEFQSQLSESSSIALYSRPRDSSPRYGPYEGQGKGGKERSSTHLLLLQDQVLTESLQPLTFLRTETTTLPVSDLSLSSPSPVFSSFPTASAAAGAAERNQFVRDVRSVAVKVISEARDECAMKVAEAASSASTAWH